MLTATTVKGLSNRMLEMCATIESDNNELSANLAKVSELIESLEQRRDKLIEDEKSTTSKTYKKLLQATISVVNDQLDSLVEAYLVVTQASRDSLRHYDGTAMQAEGSALAAAVDVIPLPQRSAAQVKTETKPDLADAPKRKKKVRVKRTPKTTPPDPVDTSDQVTPASYTPDAWETTSADANEGTPTD